MGCMAIGDEDSLISSAFSEMCADFGKFHRGNGNGGWDGAGYGISRDGCDCYDEDIYIDFLYLSKLDREYYSPGLKHMTRAPYQDE